MNSLRRILLTLASIGFVCSLCARNVEKINSDWKFTLSDQPQANQITFDDSEWRTLDLPHDWAFEGGYSADAAQRDNGGYMGGGIGWYRKAVDIPAAKLNNQVVFIDFDAVYMNSEVWVNGKYLGKRPYGYISFSYDITKNLRAGKNVISVRVDNSLEPSARWYHGCGIYGNVQLSFVNPTHFKQWATFVTTPEITADNAKIKISSEISGSLRKEMNVEYEVRDATGAVVGSAATGLDAYINLRNPKLWSTQTPYLYTLKAKISNGNSVLDQIEIPFGIRNIEWRAESGFWLNGENIKLRGVCEHLEGGPVGAAWSEKLMRWKLQLIKDMGCNAIRTAHNPQLPMFYDLCDQMGILVMDEAFDGWNKKAENDYGKQAFTQWWERDLSDFIRRDRNHPSVVIYSVGNETKGDISKDLVRVCHEQDPTRMVTSGHSGSADMDVLGINGHSEKQGFFRTYSPQEQAFIGTETPHTWQVRGFYKTQTWYRDGFPNKKQEPFETPNLTPTEIFSYHWSSPQGLTNSKQIFNSSYDNGFVRINARQNMEFLRDLPWYAGHFRWTGFDYVGEAGYVHGGWPFRAFMGGVIDLAGFEKDHYYLYQSQWSDKDMVHILPHWTHPYMSAGTKIPVWVYTTGDQVELFLNGKSLGRKSKGLKWNQMQCEWLIGWEEGTIEAVAYKNGKEIGRAKQVSAGAPARLDVSSDTNNLKADKDDVAIVTIQQLDKNGILYPYGENRVWLSVHGDARIISLESGNPVDTECNVNAKSKKPFFGLLRAFVKSTSTSDKDVSLLSAVISGDKALKISNLITIDVQEVALKGSNPKRHIEIYYTTDGSKASRSSKRYVDPFKVKQHTTVNAIVCDNGKQLLEMSETFGIGEGLYWGKPGEIMFAKTGEQAETARLTNAEILVHNDVKFVRMKPSAGSISWYQENDGSERIAKITFRYSQRTSVAKTSLELVNNGNIERIVDFLGFASKDGEWNEITVAVRLHSGANQIELRSMGGAVPDIDYINITD